MSAVINARNLTPWSIQDQPLLLATMQAEYRLLHPHSLLRSFYFLLLLFRLLLLLSCHLRLNFLLFWAKGTLFLHLNLTQRSHSLQLVSFLLALSLLTS